MAGWLHITIALLYWGPAPALACEAARSSFAELVAALQTMDDMRGARVLTVERVALTSDRCTQFWSVDVLTASHDIDILILDDATLKPQDIDLEDLVILQTNVEASG